MLSIKTNALFRRLAHFIFYGNYFYGCCTVALAVEANIQQGIPLNSLYFYLLLYFGTVVFYTYAYVQEETAAGSNKRSKWYVANHRLVKRSQSLWIIVCLGLLLYLLFKNFSTLLHLDLVQLLLPFVTSLIALAYYGIPIGIHSKLNLRKTGWFKPFAIGLVWATAVTYIPALWSAIEQETTYRFNAWFLFKNFMYISLLAILFDIKDYAADYNKKLKTFVVHVGLRKTIYYIIIPLTVLGFLSFILFAWLLHLHLLRIIINSIPFILLVMVAWSMHHRKSILYYLVVIDGLMLVKAVCGITASLLAK